MLHGTIVAVYLGLPCLLATKKLWSANVFSDQPVCSQLLRRNHICILKPTAVLYICLAGTQNLILFAGTETRAKEGQDCAC